MPKPVTDIDDDEQELRWCARRGCRWRKSRQQLLASMVMLGINRIVVTDGSINAKVVFDMRATDQAKRAYDASIYDRTDRSRNKTSRASATAAGSPRSAAPAHRHEQ